MPICLTDGERVVDPNSSRKSEHLEIALKEDLEYDGDSFFDDLELIHNPAPEIDFEEVDPSTQFLGKTLNYPFIISALTGGCKEALEINRILAQAAQHFSIGMQLGSQRVLLDSDEYLESYKVVRDFAPNILLFGNIGAPQLIKEYKGKSLYRIQRLIDLVGADALVVHLNFLQEGVMIEGERTSKGFLEAIESLVEALEVPVIVKETGCGIPEHLAVKLKDTGIYALDTGGKGGTSMARLESIRAKRKGYEKFHKVAETFRSWGIPTPISVIVCKRSGLPVIASGGIRSGLDCAKAIAIGADLVGVARPLLLCAKEGLSKTLDYLDTFFFELKLAMFLTGSRNLSDLKTKKVIIKGELNEILSQLM